MASTTSSNVPAPQGIASLSACDSTLAIAADPYRFIARACAAHGTRGVHGRILLQPTVFLTGAAAARVFYESPQLLHHDAAPKALLATLIGRGGMQTSDGVQHRHRKSVFLKVLHGPAVATLLQVPEAKWEQCVHLARHEDAAGGQALDPLMRHWLFETAVQWSGISIPPGNERARCERALVNLFDGAASSEAGHPRARASRRWVERWLGRCIEEARDDRPVLRAGGDGLAIDVRCHPALPRNELRVRGLGNAANAGTHAGEPSPILQTSVRVGYARVFVQIRPVPPLDWQGMLSAAVLQRVAITQYAAAALREGRDTICLRACRDSVSLDDGPQALCRGP